MYGRILSNKESLVEYSLLNENLRYIKENGKIYECVSIVRVEMDLNTKKIVRKQKLYDEKVLLHYDLPEDVEVEELC